MKWIIAIDKMSTYIERLKYIEKRIKCIILGHNIEYGYNYEKGLTIQRCSRCYKILSPQKHYVSDGTKKQ
jgi:hypothetical protein